jgi:hypothetical protein
MRKVYAILVVAMFVCLGCEWRMRSELKPSDDSFVLRYDRMEAFFLTSGDFSALQQMQMNYPMQTRRLIEDVLQLGKVDDAHINTRFYSFFQDTTLQDLIAEVDRQYADLDGLDDDLYSAFVRLSEMLPRAVVPIVYTQIGSLDQSIVVGDSMVGISLDKYLGADYPYYLRYGYTERQRSTMIRDYIVPDCLAFYLLSLYPASSDSLRLYHMGCVQHVVNTVLERSVFQNDFVGRADSIMQLSDGMTYDELLLSSGVLN